MRKIAIIGAGTFGKNLAIELMEEGAEVLVVDVRKAEIEGLKDVVSKAVVADASNKEVLQELGIADFDVVVVGLGDRIDVSVMTILYLREIKAKKIIAKANSEDVGKVLIRVGADEVIFPEKDSALRLAKRMSSGDIMEHITLSERYSIMEIAVPEAFFEKNLRELNFRNKYQLEVIAIRNPFKEDIIIPPAEYVFQPDDSVVVLGDNDHLKAFKQRK